MVSYAERARKANPPSRPPQSAPDPSTTMAPPASAPVVVNKPPVNVWSVRMEKMAAVRANAGAQPTSSSSSAAPSAPSASSSSKTPLPAATTEPPVPKNPTPQDDPFVVPSVSEPTLKPAPAATATAPSAAAPPIQDPEDWPQVGKPHPPAPSDGSISTSHSQPTTPSRRGEKTKWVPIPPEELQAAADAALKSRSSPSRHRSNHPRHTNASTNVTAATTSASSPLLNTTSALPHTRSHSGKTSAVPSAAHSRVQSRAGSVQSSPRVARSRRLPGEEGQGLGLGVNAASAGAAIAEGSANATATATSTSTYAPPLNNSNPNATYPSQSQPSSAVPNGAYYPPPPLPASQSSSSSAPMQSPPPPPSFHGPSPTHAYYPAPSNTAQLNGSSTPLHHLTPPPPPAITSPLSPSSHPYAYPPPIPMYGHAPYDYTASVPGHSYALGPYGPWHGHEYPPPPPRHHLSGHQSPIYPPPPAHVPPPGHYALHDALQHQQHPEGVNGTSGVPPPQMLHPSVSTSSSTASGLVFGSFGSISGSVNSEAAAGARTPDADALSVPLPLSSVPSFSSVGAGGEGLNGPGNGELGVKAEGEEGVERKKEEKEKTPTGQGKTFAIGVDANERGAGAGLPGRLRAKAKGTFAAGVVAAEGVNGVNGNGKEDADVSSSPKKTRKAGASPSSASAPASEPKAPTTTTTTATSPTAPAAAEPKKWRFGTTSSTPVQAVDRDLPLPGAESGDGSGPSSLGRSSMPPTVGTEAQAQTTSLRQSATMPELSGAAAGGGGGMDVYGGSASFVIPRGEPPSIASTSALEGGEPSASVSAASLYATPYSSLQMQAQAQAQGQSQGQPGSDPSIPHPNTDAGPEAGLEGRGYAYGGYAHAPTVHVQNGDEGERRAHAAYGRHGGYDGGWDWRDIGRQERDGWGGGEDDRDRGYRQGYQRPGYGYPPPPPAGPSGAPISGEDSAVSGLAGELDGMSLGPGGTPPEGLAGPSYPPPPHHARGDGGLPPLPHTGGGRGRRGFRGGYNSERGERGRRGGRGSNGYGGGGGGGGRGYGGGGGGRGYGRGGRQGPQQQQQAGGFGVTPPPPHFQPLPPMLGAHEQHGYYPPPRQQHQHQPQQGGQYLPPPPNGYDYSLPPPPPPSNIPPQHHQHQLSMPPPLSLPPVGAPGTPGVLGFGGAPLPPPQSTIPFPLDPVRYWLLGQLEYYLSPQNMAQDFFLRQRMDARGWIPIPLLASFNRVKLLTHDTQLVRDVLSLSQHVQVRGGMVRMSAWESFVLPDAKPSTVEDQPLPAVYQAANMGSWEEGVGFGVPQVGREGQGGELGQGEGHYDPSVPASGSDSAQQEGAHAPRPVEGSTVNGVASPSGATRRANGAPHGINGVHKNAVGGEEEFEEEEEEEDVVFVMGEEAARGGSWSPDRRS